MCPPLNGIVEFLTAIGIDVHAGEVPVDAFLPGVRISEGGLEFDPQRLCWPGDLLHEAGHLAVTPPALRARLSGALAPVDAVLHGGEIEAIAWSWAALVHLGLPAEVLFHPGGYNGQSAGLRVSYSLGVFPGAYGLAQAGMTVVGRDAISAGAPPYPHMLRWLRE